MKRATAILAIAAALTAAAEKQPFSRYRTIVERQMFGALPADFDPEKMPSEVSRSSERERQLTAEQESLKKAVHFSVLNRNPRGEVEVGFADLANPAAPIYYFLKEGESQDGWTVERADIETATATISKDDVVLELSLGDNSAKGGGSPRAAATPQPDAKSRLFGANTLGAVRRRRREERMEREAAEERRKQEDEARKQEQAARQEEERESMRQQIIAAREELNATLSELRKRRAGGANNEGNNTQAVPE